MVRTVSLLACLASASVLWAQGDPPNSTNSPLVFERHIRPILKAHCWHCHGEMDSVKGGLDLRQVRRMLKGGDSGPVIVAENSAESLLIERAAAGEMPPGDKKLSSTELATLRTWIDQGARTLRPEPEQLTPESAFTEEEQNFWSFRPVNRPAVPAVKNVAQVRNPIDRFLLVELERHDLSFSSEPDPTTLLRRLTADLHGLPPDAETVATFVSATAIDAYELAVEHLLASPRYGERWGRHWLDAAGYADSDGYSTKDLERKYAYKYRDYVISSLNADRPWNEFLLEQLAGDELLQPPYRNLAPDQAEKLIATGFLRMAPDGTGDGEVEPQIARNEAIAETIKVVTSSILGLTVGCAQCHDHRYDPISQRDYYRLRAIFDPAFNVPNWRAPAARLVSLWHDEQYARAAEIDRQKQELSDERTRVLDSIVAEVFEREVGKVPAERRPLAREAKAAPADKRTPEQQQILKDFPALNVDRGSVYLYEQQRIANHNKKYDDLAAALNSLRPPEEFAHCLTEIPGQIPPTRLFVRGDINQPRDEVEPGEPAILCGTAPITIPPRNETLPTSGRRLAWARHLTSGKHPLVARVLVNRVWMHHFGTGLVSTAGDFGFLGARPTHPELLDWLACELVDSGWSLKHLHRLILNSTAWRQSSVRRPEQDAVDPENHLLGRANVRRIEAEVLRDTILAIAGQLSSRLYGPPVPVAPDEVGQIVVAVDTRDSAGRPTGKTVSLGEDEFRRSIYIQTRRSMPMSLLESFDVPEMKPNCTQRASSTVSPQALLLMNNHFLLAQAEQVARRIQSQSGTDRAAAVRLAWQLVYTRQPGPQEIADAVEFLTAQVQAFTEQAAAPGADKALPEPELRALASYCQALLCSNRILYVE